MAVRKKKSQKESTAGTVISVRFSSDELDRIKQAARVAQVPSATFVRKSALQMAVETINGFSDPKQELALSKLAQKIANRIAGKGDLIELTNFDVDPSGEPEMRTSYIDGIYPYEEQKPSFEILEVRGLEAKDKEQLLLAVQLAAHPFVQALESALKAIFNGEQMDEDVGFQPTIMDTPK